jgi:hypothetical protein
MEDIPEDKQMSVEQLEAKNLFDDLKVALNDLTHYGSPPHIINSVAIIHDNLVNEYNKKYFPKGSGPQKPGAELSLGEGTKPGDETTAAGDETPPGAGPTQKPGERRTGKRQ